jgi:Tol biopolymer transport system component
VNLGSGVDSPGLEAAPSVSIDGHLLFFSSDRPGGQRSNDIYIARRADKHDDLSWGPATDLGPDVNTAGFEAGGVYLQSAEAGSTNLYFVRGPNSSNLNIFVAPITAGGETRGPATPVVELNDASPGISSVHPSVRTDGREVFFHSNRTGGFGATDLWVSTRPSVHDPWSTPVNLGVPLISATGVFQPTLSFDAGTLIFTSTRAGGLGNSDIWVATRQPTRSARRPPGQRRAVGVWATNGSDTRRR